MGYTYVPDVLKVRMSEGDQAKGLDCKPENDREGGMSWNSSFQWSGIL